MINLSLGGPDDRLLRELLKVALPARHRGGHRIRSKAYRGGFPASMSGVVAVSDARGTAVRVYTAPGRDVPTTQPGGRWFLVNGSSFAAAHVSGLVALVRQRQRSRRPDPGLGASRRRNRRLRHLLRVASQL